MMRSFSSRTQFEYKPLYEELVSEFCRRITVGRWPVGRPLKTEAMIASELGVSLGTVRRAFDRLESMNLIDRSPGRGTIVCEFDSERRLASLTNVVDADGKPVMGDISIGEVDAIEASDEIAGALELAPGAAVLRIGRTRAHFGRVFAVETAFVAMPENDVKPERDALWSSARTLVVAGQIAVGRKEYARAVDAVGAAAVPVFGETGDPLLEVRRTLLTFEERPLEFCLTHCRLGPDLNYRVC